MTDTFPLPPPPDPVKVAQWAGQLRTLIAVLAGMGLVGGVWAGVSAEQIANMLTAVLTLAGVAGWAWSAIKSAQDKTKQRQEKVATAMVSAAQGVPLVVSVTPPGVENTVAQVSATEQAAAPTVPQGAMVQPAPLGP